MEYTKHQKLNITVGSTDSYITENQCKLTRFQWFCLKTEENGFLNRVIRTVVRHWPLRDLKSKIQ
jgi:hypothetical protein